MTFCTQLENLLLQNNALETLKGLSGLTNLKELDISENDLAELPSMENLADLQSFNCSKNKISFIPNLANLSLQLLNISYNPIEDLSGVELPASLYWFTATHAQLEALPSFFLLEHLSGLDVSYNQLNSLPETYPGHKFSYLDISFNRFMKLPKVNFKCFGNSQVYLQENELNDSNCDTLDDWLGNCSFREFVFNPQASGPICE